MVFFHPAILFTIVTSFIGLIVAPISVPVIILNSDHGIKYLWNEAAEGRFRYDLSRDYPPLHTPWQEFLSRRGGGIVSNHYTNTQGEMGWNSADREA